MDLRTAQLGWEVCGQAGQLSRETLPLSSTVPSCTASTLCASPSGEPKEEGKLLCYPCKGLPAGGMPLCYWTMTSYGHLLQQRLSLLGNILRVGDVCVAPRTAVRAVCGSKCFITEGVWRCRFSDLNLPPKNWTFPCTVATLGEIKVSLLAPILPKLLLAQLRS